jgi:hypothetical protein
MNEILHRHGSSVGRVAVNKLTIYHDQNVASSKHNMVQNKNGLLLISRIQRKQLGSLTINCRRFSLDLLLSYSLRFIGIQREIFFITKFEFGGRFGMSLVGDCHQLEVNLDLELLITFGMSLEGVCHELYT